MLGYKFRVMWFATGFTETINASCMVVAERKIRRRYKDARAFWFVETTLPIPPDQWLAKMPKKVF